MHLKDVFDSLAFGELRQLFIDASAAPTDTIPEAKRRMVWNNIKLGLTELHKRFAINEKRFTLEIQDGQAVYLLNKKFAQSNTKSTEAVKYIADAQYNFLDDLLKIERVLDEDEEDLPLNDLGAEYCVRTPRYDTIVLPADLEDEALTVVYRADHPPIAEHFIEKAPQMIPIYLAPAYLEALCLYVASRMTNPNGIAGQFHTGNNYFTKFEASCAMLEQKGYGSEVVEQDTRYRDPGWA